MIENENEILVTLVGTLVVVLTTISQIWAMSRAKFKQNQKMLALENTLNHGNAIKEDPISACKKKNCSLFCNVSYLLQILFGILVFISFTCWAVYLVSVGLIDWAPLPGSLALIGLMTPIIAWRGFKHRHQAMSQLIKDIETCKKIGREDDKKASEQLEQSEKSRSELLKQPDSVKPAIVEPEIVAKPEPVRQIIPETVVLPEKRVAIQAKSAVIEKQKIPQDSILKRHFFTTLRLQAESGYPARPTDSILKRHFENFIVTEMEKYVSESIEPLIKNQSVAKSIEPPVTPAAVAVSKPKSMVCAKVHKHKLPQDSILRRHFLSRIQVDIESGLPSRPTDSILKRHYDSLIATKMAKRLDELNA